MTEKITELDIWTRFVCCSETPKRREFEGEDKYAYAEQAGRARVLIGLAAGGPLQEASGGAAI